jgi:hypothetical protein
MSPDLKEFVWKLIGILERRKIITKNEPRTDYCNACDKTHRFGFMIHNKTGDSFHICEPIGKAVIDRQRDDKSVNMPKRFVIDLDDLFNQLFE